MSFFRKSVYNPTADPMDTRIGEVILQQGEADVVFLGFPFDMASSTRPGSRFGPSRIRQNLYSLPYQGGLRLTDLGDVDVVNGDPEKSWKNCTGGVSVALETGKRVCVIGGDSTTSYCAFRALRRKAEGGLFYLLLDAHPDVRAEYKGLTSGRVVRWIAEQDQDAKLAVAGIRKFSNSPYLFREARKLGLELSPIEELEGKGKTELIERWSQLAKGRQTHLSVNIDVFDPSCAPGTNSPSPGGLYPREGLELVETICKRLKPTIFDVVEVSPLYDHADITCQLASSLIARYVWST
jgi:formimidoylglutamase